VRRKLRIPILPYECKCQCNKTYDIYGDHPFNCPKNHKGRPHNMITNKFSQALAPLLTTANIISPTTNLNKEINLHLPADPTARPFDVSYKPNIDCHSSNVFSLFNDRLRYHNYQCHSSAPLQPSTMLLHRLQIVSQITLLTQISLYKTMKGINSTDQITAEQPDGVIFSTTIK